MRVGGDFIKFDTVGDTASGTITAVRAHRFDDGSVAPQILITTDDVTRGKPDPESALLGLDRLGATAGDTWYVGDAVSDVAMALAAGMRALGITTGAATEEELREAGAEVVVTHASDVVGLVRG